MKVYVLRFSNKCDVMLYQSRERAEQEVAFWNMKYGIGYSWYEETTVIE